MGQHHPDRKFGRPHLRAIGLLLGVVALATAGGLAACSSDSGREVASVVPDLVTTASLPSVSSSSASASSSVIPSQMVAPETSAGMATPAQSASEPVQRQGITPAYLEIPSLYSGLKTTVAPAASVMAHDQFLGKEVSTFTFPKDMETTTWWSADVYGTPAPKPGDNGMALIFGHTQVGGGYGVFNDLGNLKGGDDIFLSDGTTTVQFRVLADQPPDTPKSDETALFSVLSGHPANAGLALVTCSGNFNGSESDHNTVRFAELVGSFPTPQA